MQFATGHARLRGCGAGLTRRRHDRQVDGSALASLRSRPQTVRAGLERLRHIERGSEACYFKHFTQTALTPNGPVGYCNAGIFAYRMAKCHSGKWLPRLDSYPVGKNALAIKQPLIYAFADYAHVVGLSACHDLGNGVKEKCQ